MSRVSLGILGLLVMIMFGTHAHADEAKFQAWLSEFKVKAAREGIAKETLDRAFDGISENLDVVALDRKQPEKKITLTRYLQNTISERRIRIGREKLAEHRELLQAISLKYGVQPKFIVALWGIESDFGNYTGGFMLTESLATLAYEGRRASFFSKELIAALRIMENEKLTPEEMTGSWAGAMGQCQFMPSTYLSYAADGDGDGDRDIWTSEADVFASIANYLQSLDWDDTQGWGKYVELPADFKTAEADIKTGQSATYWRKRGLRYTDDGQIAGDDTILYAIYPGTEEEGALLITGNFQALLEWNRSRYFATAVGTLADAIGEGS
jgi:membrane-bound lytic murein transglycosylase B